jgi:hypothetical protein
MHPLIHLRAILVFFVALASFGLSPRAQAVVPPPDGGYPGQNTAEGDDALFGLTTGTDNTAVGFQALSRNKTGSFNTATGSQALFSNADQFGLAGNNNTATGFQALFSNLVGDVNTAIGSKPAPQTVLNNQ